MFRRTLLVLAVPCSLGVSALAQAPKPASPARPLGWLAIPPLGVKLEVPADSRFSEGSYSISVTSDSFPDCYVIVSRNDHPEIAESFDRTVSGIKSGEHGVSEFGAFTRQDKAPDGGWKIEWTGKDSFEHKPFFGVDDRVVLGKTQYSCGGKAKAANGAACIAHACSSLSKP